VSRPASTRIGDRTVDHGAVGCADGVSGPSVWRLSSLLRRRLRVESLIGFNETV
jgi:hypothetical protein